MSIINEYVKNNRINPLSLFPLVKELICADGFSMSVQASKSHYCTPRETNADYYHSMEVGYPSSEEDSLQIFKERNGSDIYGYVPIEIIDAIIIKHGGLMRTQ